MKMKMRSLLLVVAASSLMTAQVMARDGGTVRVTVGQFATQVATVLGRDTRSIETVKESLWMLGVNVDFDTSAPLTTGMAARIARELGVRVTAPSDSKRVMSAGQASTLAGYIGSVRAGIEDESVEPPTQCLTSQNRGHCVECCKTATGSTGEFCGRFCHANVSPPPSPEEPTP